MSTPVYPEPRPIKVYATPERKREHNRVVSVELQVSSNISDVTQLSRSEALDLATKLLEELTREEA